MPPVLFLGGKPLSSDQAQPGSIIEWLRQRPAWVCGTQDGNATLSRTYSFDDDFDMGGFLTRLTELVTADQGHGLAREDRDLTALVTLIHDQPEPDRTFLRYAEECDALYQEFCEDGEHDPYAEDTPDDSDEFAGEDDDWD